MASRFLPVGIHVWCHHPLSLSVGRTCGYDGITFCDCGTLDGRRDFVGVT